MFFLSLNGERLIVESKSTVEVSQKSIIINLILVKF